MKIFRKILSIIQIIALLAIFIIHYFTKHKMGMQRHVMYKNMMFEQQVNMNVVMPVVIAVMILMFVYLTYKIIKHKTSKLEYVLFVNLFVFAILMANFSKNIFELDYNVAIVLSSVVCILQFIKATSSSY
ncbi:MAG: hypothetical protein E6117_01325 [Finegoldia magna]|uniref:hypothetical protein n=1 Tax=Finegoldia TaxID=150022 RepID=UPI000B91A729|nr:hypothetical protein [Finegoldia magna]MDU2897525.1 hypothetical protein [Finegoldia magna]MDU4571481.1 hypothetical protein [Finegoldia magna]MDU5369129.1 hypothetical protein [Finegoldia magna]MDU5443366.1 hypothetical protein [Finegoldia magna]MDU5977807.1 hypothetical protein [Finegoldia magna]